MTAARTIWLGWNDVRRVAQRHQLGTASAASVQATAEPRAVERS